MKKRQNAIVIAVKSSDFWIPVSPNRNLNILFTIFLFGNRGTQNLVVFLAINRYVAFRTYKRLLRKMEF